MVSETVRFYFDSFEAAAGGLLTVLLDARETESTYRFGPLDARAVFNSGLVVEGEVTDVAAKVEGLPGVIRQNE